MTEMLRRISKNYYRLVLGRRANNAVLFHLTQTQCLRHFSTMEAKGYGKQSHSKSTSATKFILRVQSITNDTPEHQIEAIFADIAANIPEYNPYELIDLTYFLTRLNKSGCQDVALPLLHRFFSLPDRNSCVNGVYIHRLLRSLFIFQDAVYREWIYEIAGLIGSRHSHLLMRDLQLIIDDLSLFYDAAAQHVLSQFEESVVSRVDEIEPCRLPFFIHSLGRSGYSSLLVAKSLFNALERTNRTRDISCFESLGLILKGYGNFKFHPGTDFLNKIWYGIDEPLDKVEYKYLSWSSEGLLRMRHFTPVFTILDQIFSIPDKLSHLELTDLETDLWHIQSFLIAKRLSDHIAEGCIWQDEVHTRLDGSAIKKEKDYSDTTITKLLQYYQRILKILREELSDHIYECTPPYRASQFELLTRILDFCPYPRDFSFSMDLAKYDMTFPILKVFQSDSSDEVFRIYPFKDGTVEQLASDSFTFDDKEAKVPDIKPLSMQLKTYLHALAFRTPALAPRGLRLFMHGLVRIRFEEREESGIDKELIPPIKATFHTRPLSRALIREFRRKLYSFNPDDLIISTFCSAQLNLFVLDKDFVNDVEKHIKWLEREKRLNEEQLKYSKKALEFAKKSL